MITGVVRFDEVRIRPELFGSAATPKAVEDALALQRLLASGRTWCQAAPVADPQRVRALAGAGQLGPNQQVEIRQALEQVRSIADRYRDSTGPLAELHRVAAWVAGRWSGDAGKLLQPTGGERGR